MKLTRREMIKAHAAGSTLLVQVDIDTGFHRCGVQPDDAAAQAMMPQPVKLPEEKPEFSSLPGDLQSSPAAPEFAQMQLSEKPTVSPMDMRSMEMPGGGAVLKPSELAITESLSSLETGILPAEREQAGMATAGAPLAPSGPAVGASQLGFSNLDELLARTGPLSPETAPILLPTDLLFDYDSDALRPEAEESLRKLAALILRNPQFRFLIEGHTDSFGSDEYNLDLSARRARNVRDWLERNMGIPAGRVGARGLGESRLIAPASGTVEEQQINRRVEIVVLSGAGE